MIEAPRLLTPTQVADLLACSRRHAQDLMGSGQIQSYRIGRCLRTTAEDIVSYLSRARVQRGPDAVRPQERVLRSESAPAPQTSDRATGRPWEQALQRARAVRPGSAAGRGGAS